MSAAGNDGATSELDTSLSDEVSKRVDVHVLVVPVVAWRSDLRFAYSSVCLESSSAGFVRVAIHTTLVSLREEVASQLSPSLLPGQYVFLRNLGRCFSWISCKQEESMTVSMFIPPMTASPEVYVIDAACFHGFPEGIVGTNCNAVNNNRHSYPIDHNNRLLPGLVTHLSSQQAISPHHPDQNLVFLESRDASPPNFNNTGNRKITQQQLPNLLPRRHAQHHQAAAVHRQRAHTLDGSDLVQHNFKLDHLNAANPIAIHSNISPSKAGSINDSLISNSLSDHSSVIDDLPQEPEVLTTCYGPNWQSSATQSLVVADSAANSLCSTTLPSSLNGAHHGYSPIKSVMDSPSVLHEGNSSGSKTFEPRVNVDLNLADSVITENTEVLERALFGSRGDGEGSSLTNSLLNITGGTSGHRLQQNYQSQLQDYNHTQLPSYRNSQPHPQSIPHHNTGGGYGNQQSNHTFGHHSNTANTSSPSNHGANENTSVSHMVTSTPSSHSGVNNDHTIIPSVSDERSINQVITQGDSNGITISRSLVVEQSQNVEGQPHSNQQSNNTSQSKASSKSNAEQRRNTEGQQSIVDTTKGQSSTANRQAATNMDPSNNSLNDNNEQLSSPDDRAASPHSNNTQGSDVNGKTVSNNSSIVPSDYQCNNTDQKQLNWKDSVSSDVIAVRSSVEGDGCSQSRVDDDATVDKAVSPSEHHVTTTDGEHQLEHTVLSSSTPKLASSAVENNKVIGSFSQKSSPSSDQQQPLSTEHSLQESGKVVKQQSPLSQREAGVGTSMLFSSSPLPPITSLSDKNSSTSEANGKPAELDEVNQLLAQLRIARDDRRTLENVKRGLSDTVKKLQRAKKGAQDREDRKWKKMFFQEKKLTQANEDKLRRLRNEVYRRMGTMATISQQDSRAVHQILSPIAISEGPSEMLNVKIQCARVEQDLSKLRQRLIAAQEKLKVEKEARTLVEAENRMIRKNVLQQKINCTLTRTI